MTTAEIEVEQSEEFHSQGDRDPLQHVVLKVTGNLREEIAAADQPISRITIDLASAAVIADGDPKTRLLGIRGRRREVVIEGRNCWMIDEARIVQIVVSTSHRHPHQQKGALLEVYLRHVARRVNVTEITVHSEEKRE